MPPIVASQEHVSAHPELHRTSGFTVLRAQYDRSNSNCGGVDTCSSNLAHHSTPMDLPQHNKVVGGHLVLGKRSSTPAGHHYALTATVSLLGSQHSALLGGKVSPTSSSSSRSDSPAGLTILEQHALGGGNFHRRLDRSHSEPVWQQQLQQQQQQLQDGRPGTNSSRYKTELCRPYEENGFCKYGDKCQFAHGGAELRTLNRHPKYKTELCRTFHTIGICPYGPRCHFIHNAEESRVSSPAMSALPMPGSFLSQFALGNHHRQNQMTGSPPPALVPVSSSSPTNQYHHHHQPLTISPPPSSSMGLPTIFDKNSPPSSIGGGSPTSPNIFFDESSFPYFRTEFLDSFAESFNAMSLNNKAALQNSPNNQLNNQINNHLNNNNTNNNLNNSFSNINDNLNNLGLGHFSDLLSDSSMSSSGSSSNGDNYQVSSMLSSIDTPPASPPDTSSNRSLEDTVSNINSMRLPIFQSINSVQ